MADWYVSSAAYATRTAFATSHAYSIGDIVVPTAPALKAKWVFRCTTAGTSSTEPTWATTNNATSTSGTAVFTNVTGQSAYFWTAAAGDLPTICNTNNRLSGGDRVFISSDHTETQTATTSYGVGPSGPSGYAVVQFICVNRAGSTPPVAADVTTGASLNCSASINFIQDSPCFLYGLSITSSNANAFCMSTSTSASVQHTLYFQACVISCSANSSSPTMFANNTGIGSRVVLDNTVCNFGNASQKFGAGPYSTELVWVNTPSGSLTGSAPTILIQNTGSSGGALLFTFRGIDLSAVTGNLVKSTSGGELTKVLFDSCKIASAVTRYNVGLTTADGEEVELVNCYDGTNIVNERYTIAGTLTTERTITLSGGATDNVGTFSHKIVTTANLDKFVNTMTTFWLDVNYTTTGSSKTATVEIISSAALNNDEISLYLEYEGTASSSLASWVNNFIATPLTVASAVTTSTATWNSSPATPAKQKLQVTFTPQTAGPVRGVVRVGKASTTVYVNPQITVT